MRTLFTLILTLLFTSCNGTNYKIEKQLFDCLVSSAKTVGVDLNKELKAFENHLIDCDVLKDRSGESYFQIYKQIEKENNINFSFSYSLLDTISFHSNSKNLKEIQLDCSDNFEKILNSEDYKKSKLYELNIILDSERESGRISASEIASTITNFLTPADFDQNYYKMTLMLTLVASQDIQTGLEKRLLPLPKNDGRTQIKERNIVNIHVTENPDSVLFNNRMIAIKKLSEMTKGFILSNKTDTLKPELRHINIQNIGDCYQSKLIISLSNEKKTKYETYVKVQNQLLKAYELARNDVSMKYFKKQFSALSNSEKKAIKELIPSRIRESEPE